MPPTLTEAVSSQTGGRAKDKKSRKTKTALELLEGLEEHILLDGFRVILDLEKSQGSYLYDADSDRRLIDLYGFFGSMAVGFNHPYLNQSEVEADLLRAAKVKVANSDVYSEAYAEFVETFIESETTVAQARTSFPATSTMHVSQVWIGPSCGW